MIPRDLRLRLIVVILTITCISQLRLLPAALAVTLFALVVAAQTLPRRNLMHRLLHVEAFTLLLFLTLPFSMPGTDLFSIGPLVASSEGIYRAALLAAKIAASVLLATALLADAEPAKLGSALRSLRVPQRFIQLLVLTTRYSSTIVQESSRLREAMRARSFRPRSNWHSWRSYGYLIGMTLIRAMDRAQRVHEAMLCRGFDGNFRVMTLPRPSPSDWTRAVAFVGIGILAFAADRI